MQYLIDTHVLIWYLNGDKTLSKKHIDLLENTENKLYLSIANIGELAIKMSSGKLECSKTFPEIEEFILSMDYEILNISFSHLKIFYNLPKHHGDPFDRMLISQSIAENIPVISVDKLFKAYPVILFGNPINLSV